MSQSDLAWYRVLCTMRHCNQLLCPIELFNPRWRRDFQDVSRPSVIADIAFASGLPQSNDRNSVSSEEQRISELSAITKSLILSSVSEKTTYDMVVSAIKSLQDTVARCKNLRQTHPDEDDIPVRNPIQARTKGRPKTGRKRYVSQAELQRSKRKKSKSQQ
jgi:hypothetical protein